MKNQSMQERLLASFICGIAIGLMSVVPAIAQTQPDESLEALDEIVVTGSRIPQPNMESVSPIATVSKEDIQITGTQRIEDLLNNMPQVLTTDTVNMGNLSSGTATVRTLPLSSALSGRTSIHRTPS